MAKTYTTHILIGGNLGALDAIDGALLDDTDNAITTTPDGLVYHYTLDEDSGAAESSPDVIAPDNNPGTKRWILAKVTGEGVSNIPAGNIESTNVQSAINELDFDKLDVNALSANLNLYPTTTPSDIATYFKLVSATDDPDYNSSPVDVSTGVISTENQLISSLASVAGLIIGDPGVINVTVIGNIKRISGVGTANFYFKMYHRDSIGDEVLIATSNNTLPVESSSYVQFSATALLSNGPFIETDRIVLNFYANRITGATDPTYNFQFGGSLPVRALLPLPLSAAPLLTIEDVHDDLGGTVGGDGFLRSSDGHLIYNYDDDGNLLILTVIPSICYTPTGIEFGNTDQEYDVDGEVWVNAIPGGDLGGVPNLDSGKTLADCIAAITVSRDGHFLNVREGSGTATPTNPMTTHFIFSGVANFNSIHLRSFYHGSVSHKNLIRLWNKTTLAFDTYDTFSGESDFVSRSIEVFSPANYIDNGVVILQYIHTSNGLITHHQEYDYVALCDGGGGSGGASIASAIAYVPSGNLTGTNVQTAIDELEARGKALNHLGTVSSGIATIDFDFTDNSLNTAGAHAWSFENAAEDHPDTSVLLIVTTPTTITVPADTVFYSTQTLSALPIGDYQVEIFSSRPRLSFDAGANEILVGDVLTGVTTGHTGTVTEVVVTSGTWGGNDAAGFVTMQYDNTGVFQNDEDLTSVRLTPTVHAVADGVVKKYGVAVGAAQ